MCEAGSLEYRYPSLHILKLRLLLAPLTILPIHIFQQVQYIVRHFTHQEYHCFFGAVASLLVITMSEICLCLQVA